MSIAYQQMDESVPQVSGGSMTEYDRRKLLAQKSMDDAVRRLERVKSLERGAHSLSPRQGAKDGHHHHHLPVPLPAKEEGEPQGEDSEFSAASSAGSSDWWKKTDQAFLNEKPDKALADEATNSQFAHTTYTPQYAVASGAHVPEYMRSPNKKAQAEVHAI